MAAIPPVCDFGWRPTGFRLKATDGKTYTLDDVTGPEAMESLRKSMVRRANATMGGKGRIINAWPEEWIVQ